MSPTEPARSNTLLPDDGTVPDDVLELEAAASYLPEGQRALLRRAWAVGAAAGSVSRIRITGGSW